METKQSFSTSEVAGYCHVTADTIRKWAEAGRVRAFKTPGGHRRIRREDLLQFLRENDIPVHADLKEAKIKILIVGAEKSVASSITRFLERSSVSFLVEVAADGFDAGHQMAVFQPDVVFLDLRSTGMDGLELCRRITGKREYAGIQVIAMAPAEAGDMISRAVDMGAAGGLKKPFTPDDLRRVLAHAGVEVA